MSFKDEPRPGRSPTFNQYALRELVESNPRKSTLELALDLNTFQSTALEKDRKSEQARCLGSSYS